MAHIHFVEGGELGGGVLRFLQPQRDGLAQPGHGTRSSRAAWRAGRRARRRARRAARGGAGGEGAQHVALGDAAILAGAGDGRRWRCRFLQRCAWPTAWRGHRFGAAGRGLRRPGARRRLCCLAASSPGRFRLGGRGRCRLCLRQSRPQRADLDGGAGLGGNGFKGAIGGRGHFHRHLVGFQFQQGSSRSPPRLPS